MKSIIKQLGEVTFPEFKEERVYMLPFLKHQGLPEHLNRWQPTIDMLLKDIDTKEIIYLMIDSAYVRKGHTHRRAGPHVDGNWIVSDAVKAHGAGTGGRHGVVVPSPEPNPKPEPPTLPGHNSGLKSNNLQWKEENFYPEALLLASNVTASCAYIGDIDVIPKAGGACSHADLSSYAKVYLEANKAYIGNVTMVHESLPVPYDCNRSLVRLNIPAYTF